MKKVKIGLLGKILIAIALGIGLGLIVPGWMVRIFLTFNGIFSQFLGFVIPLIIVGLVTPAISLPTAPLYSQAWCHILPARHYSLE